MTGHWRVLSACAIAVLLCAGCASTRGQDLAEADADIVPLAEDQIEPLFTEPDFVAAEPDFREKPPPPAVPPLKEPVAAPAEPPAPEAPLSPPLAAQPAPAPPSAPSTTPESASQPVLPPPKPPPPPAVVKPAETVPKPVQKPAPKPARPAETPKPAASVETPAPLNPPPPQNAPPAQITPSAGSGLPARPVPVETTPPPRKQISRVVRALVGQIVEVPFRGAGWVYLGEQDSKRGAAYDSRRLDNQGQTFIFRVEEEGDYRLQFSKQDFVNNSFIEDIVEVIAAAAPPAQIPRFPGEKTRVTAEPRWPVPAGSGGVSTAESAAAASDGFTEEVADASNADINAAAPISSGGAMNPDAAPIPEDYLARARTSLAGGKFSDVIATLDRLRNEKLELPDEAWWLYGQSFESPSEARDIKAAVDAYGHIIRDFPQSRFFNDARSRLTYLNRFYFNIR